MATWFGMNAPFIGGNEKVLSRQIDDKLIRNDLLQLLLTSPGERVMRPDFGSGIRQFLFQPITDNQIEELRENIKMVIERYERRVILTDVQVLTDPDNNLINIKIYGFFNFDRFNSPISSVEAAELLVELGESTSKTMQVPVGA